MFAQQLSYRLLHYAPQAVISHPATALGVAVAHCLFWVYLAVSAVDIGRGLAVAALNYSLSNRFVLVTFKRPDDAAGSAIVFDTTDGAVTARPLPPEIR